MGKVPPRCQRAVRKHPAILEIADRLAFPLPSAEQWTPTKADGEHFLIFVESLEQQGKRAGRRKLPAARNVRYLGPAMGGFSAAALAQRAQEIRDASCPADWRDYYRWQRENDVRWSPPRFVTVPFEEDQSEPFREFAGAIPWGGAPRLIRGLDRVQRLEEAFAVVRAARPEWKATAVWDELAATVNVVARAIGRRDHLAAPPTVTGRQLSELARPRQRRRRKEHAA